MIYRLFETMLVLSFTGSLLSLPLLLSKKFILERWGGKWYYYIWLHVLLALILPIGYMGQIILNFPRHEFLPYAVIKATDTVQPSIAYGLSQKISIWLHAVSHNQIIAAFWLFGVIFTMGYQAFVYRLFLKKLLRGNVAVTDSKAVEILRQCSCDMKIRRKVALCSSDEIRSPVLIGIFRPMIVLPSGLVANAKKRVCCSPMQPGLVANAKKRVCCSPMQPAIVQSDDLELIIIHELTHYKNKDIQYKLFLLLVKSIHWFNPMIYAIAKAVNESCEYACDDNITARHDSEFIYRYTNMLVNTMQIAAANNLTATYPATSLFRSKSNIKRRFHLIMMQNKKNATVITVFAMAAILGLSIYSAIATQTPDSDLNLAKMQTVNIESTETPPSLPNPANGNIYPCYENVDGVIVLHITDGDIFVQGDGTYKVIFDDPEETIIVDIPKDENGSAISSLGHPPMNPDSGEDDGKPYMMYSSIYTTTDSSGNTSKRISWK